MTEIKMMRSARATMSRRAVAGIFATALAALVPAAALAVETDRLTVEDPATGAVMFRVTSGGNVTGAAFAGDGSALTNVAHFKGAWNADTAYSKDDCVSYNGSSFIALAASTNLQPDVTPASWAALASKGTNGQDGVAGPQGPPGPQGPQGVAGKDGKDGSPDTQSQILSKLAGATDGATLTLSQGPSELASAVKLGVNNAAGANVFAVNGNGQVGIGTALPSSRLHINSVETAQDAMGEKFYYTTSAAAGYNNNGTFVDVTSSPATDSTAEVQALYGNARTAVGSTVNHNAIYGLRFSARHNGTGLLNSATGVYAYPFNNGTGTINNAYGLYTRPWMTKGTINNWYGIFVDVKNLGTGTVGNMYGLYVNEPAASNFFAGNVGIGSATPSQKLEVNGGVRMNTTAAKPACDLSSRGTFWFTQGGGTADDSVSVCSRIGGAYVWKVLY